MKLIICSFNILSNGSPRNENLNLLVRINFLNLLLYSKNLLVQTVLLVLGQRTGAHCEDWNGKYVSLA
jgi:hypothetical protein